MNLCVWLVGMGSNSDVRFDVRVHSVPVKSLTQIKIDCFVTAMSSQSVSPRFLSDNFFSLALWWYSEQVFIL